MEFIRPIFELVQTLGEKKQQELLLQGIVSPLSVWELGKQELHKRTLFTDESTIDLCSAPTGRTEVHSRFSINSIFKMCIHFQNIKFGVQAPLVEIELTVWQKNWGRAKAWSAISYILLISTLSLHGKKGMQP